MADSVAASAVGQRGWVVPSLAVIALVVLGLGYYGVSEINRLSQRIEALSTQNGDLSKTLGDAPQKFEDLDKRLASVEAPLASLGTRLSSLEQATPALAADLGGVTADIASLKTGLASLQTQIGDVAPDKLAALRTQIDQVASSIPAIPDTSQLETKVVALDGQVQALQTQISAASSAPPPASGDLAALQTEIADLKAKVAAVDVAPLTSGLGDVKAQVDRLDTQIAALPARADLTALQTRLDQIANAPPATPPAAPAVDLRPLETDIGDLKSRVAAVEISGKADSGTIASLRTELDGLTSRVGGLETANPASDVSALQSSLGDLKQQIGVLASGTDVKALQAAVADLQNQPKPVAPAVQPTLLTQIYFERGSYKLSDTETQKLATLAAQLRDKPRDVAVLGFSDTQGPAEFNRSLSLKRASAVRKVLLAYGIGNSLVTSISGLGDDGPPVATGANVVEPANRTVMVYGNE